MSSDLYVLDGSFFSDLFSPIDVLQTVPDTIHDPILQNPVDEPTYFHQTSPNFFSTSPPSNQLENLSICQTQTTHYPDVSDSLNPFADFPCLEVKTEESQFPLHLPHGYESFGPPHSAQNVGKMMQRSYSSNCFDGKPSFLFQPRFDSLLESPNLQPKVISSPERSFSTGQVRRVCSTGDLQVLQTTQTNQRLSSSPLATESSFMEEANLKVGRYSAEERKERIHRYKAKRTQRNFNKTIKYACRKTLADNRPRIRGRFARNEDSGEIPKVATSNRYEDEDDLWIDGLHEEVDEGAAVGMGPFFNIMGQTQIQYYGYS